jgi:hypothetical protein
MRRLRLLLLAFLFGVSALPAASVTLPGVSRHVTLSPDGETLAYIDSQGDLNVVETQSGHRKFPSLSILSFPELASFVPSTNDRLPGFRISNDGRRVTLIDTASGQPRLIRMDSRDLGPLDNHRLETPLGELDLDGNGQMILGRTRKGGLMGWDTRLGHSMIILPELSVEDDSPSLFMPGSVRHILHVIPYVDTFHPYAVSINRATYYSDGQDEGYQELIRKAPYAFSVNEAPRTAAVSDKGETLLLMANDSAFVWDARTSQGIGPIVIPISETANLPVLGGAVSGDGKIAALIYDEGIHLFGVDHGDLKPLIAIPTANRVGGTAAPVAARISRDGKFLIVARPGTNIIERHDIPHSCGDVVTHS